MEIVVTRSAPFIFPFNKKEKEKILKNFSLSIHQERKNVIERKIIIIPGITRNSYKILLNMEIDHSFFRSISDQIYKYHATFSKWQ